MQIGIFRDAQEVADAAAKVVIDAMSAADQEVIGVATGSTPLPLYERLRAAHAQGTFTLSGAKAFALDEYIGIDPEHPERYRNVLRAELVGDDKTGLADDDLHTPDGNAPDPRAAADEYDQMITESGGVAIQILGIGSDGHIGFNEPGGALTSRTHIESLMRQTREDNARFFDNDIDKVPTTCITQGLSTIMDAKATVLIATGEGKADAVRELIEGGISALWPATILQMHPNTTVLVDEAAASKLQHAEYYKERWEGQQ